MLKRLDLTPARIVFLAVILAFLGAFLIYPLGYVFVNAFFVDQEVVKAEDSEQKQETDESAEQQEETETRKRFTLKFFKLLVTDPSQWTIVLNSINLGLAVTVATTLVAIPMAFAMVRYQFPGKGLMAGLLMVPMVLPPFVGAVGMKQMFARFGSINLLLMHAGLIENRVDWFAGGGMLSVVIMEVLHLYPIMYLNVAAALANVDPSLEEAGRNVGAGGFSLFRRVTFPLMLPGYFAGAVIVFIWAFTDLGTPLIFDYRRVVPVVIFDKVNAAQEDPMAYTLVVLLIAMTVGFFYLSKRVVGTRRYEMLARGRAGERTRRASPAMCAVIYTGMLTVIFIALIPHASVVLTSLAERWFMTVLPTAWTGEHFANLLSHDVTMGSIRMSFFLSCMSTTANVVLGIGLAYLLTRTRIPGRNLLDTLAMLPLAVPGIIIAFGYIVGFTGTALDPIKRNPMALLAIAYAVRRLPYMVRSAYAGFQQTSISLEEAAQNVGAGPGRTMLKITLPLVFANLIAGGILCFSFAMLEVSDSLMLAREERFYPITRAIYSLLGRPDGRFIASALGVVGMVLLAGSLMVAGKFLGKRMGELFRA